MKTKIAFALLLSTAAALTPSLPIPGMRTPGLAWAQDTGTPSGTVGSPSVQPSIGPPPDRPVEVSVGLYVIDVSEIDERHNSYTIEVDVVAGWKDPRAAFEPGPGEPTTRTYLETRQSPSTYDGWSPQLHAVNAIVRNPPDFFKTVIHPHGQVVLRGRVKTTLRARLDFRRFPFDHQALPIYVESFSYNDAIVQLAPQEDFSGFSPEFEMPEWEVTEVESVASEVHRQHESTPYSRESFLIHIQRRSGFYIWKVMLPLFVIVAISWVVFWMTGDFLGRRAGISSTGMLTIIAYQFIISDSLPRVSYLTFMDYITLTSLVAVAATMVVNIVAANVAEHLKAPIDRTCRVVFPTVYIGLILMFFSRL